MAKKETAPEIEDANVVDSASLDDASNVGSADYNPLGEAVKERDYTKPKVDPTNLEAEIEEPTFTPPSFEDMEEPAGFAQEQEQGFANPALNELDDKDKKMATEQMVDVVLDGYDKLTGLANNMVQVKPQRLNKMIANGDIDPRIRIPTDTRGNSISINEFVDEFNEQTAEAITTTDEFKKEVRPAMVRVFSKRGIGLTDEQFLMYKFGSDLATKGVIVFQLRNQVNDIFQMMKDMTAQNMATQTPPPPPPPSNGPAPAPAPEPTPEPEPEVEYMEPEEEVVGFQDNGPTFEGAPEFGDPEILAELSRLSEEGQEPAEKPKRKRGRPRKKK